MPFLKNGCMMTSCNTMINTRLWSAYLNNKSMPLNRQVHTLTSGRPSEGFLVETRKATIWVSSLPLHSVKVVSVKYWAGTIKIIEFALNRSCWVATCYLLCRDFQDLNLPCLKLSLWLYQLCSIFEQMFRTICLWFYCNSVIHRNQW